MEVLGKGEEWLGDNALWGWYAAAMYGMLILLLLSFWIDIN